MPTTEPKSAPVSLSELVDALHFVSASNLDEHHAYVCKRTGRIIYVSDDVEEDMELPDDPDPVDYPPVPHQRQLDLGRRLALSFVAEQLPGAYDKAGDMFRRKGAYSRFMQLLRATGTLDKWYRFEADATESALERWCDQVGVTLISRPPRQP